MALEQTIRPQEAALTGVLTGHTGEEGHAFQTGGSAALVEEQLPGLLPPGLPHPQGLLHHRVREFTWHIPWYGFKTQARLARDSGVSPSTVSRLLRGRELPSLVVALRLTQALSQRLNRPLDIGEVFSLDGLYPNSVCHLTGCRSCLPPTAYDRSDNFLANSPGMETGQWVMPLSRKGER